MKMKVGLVGAVCLMAAHVFGGADMVGKALGLAEQGRIEEAIDVLSKPQDNGDRIQLARLLDYDGQTDKAITTLRAGLHGEIEDLDLFDVLLTFYARRGEDGPTVSYKRGTISCSPSKDKVAEDAWKLEQYKLALEVCDKALKIEPKAEYFQYQRAVMLGALKRYEEAVKIYEALIVNYPEGPDLRLELSLIHMESGMTNEAVACLKAAVELDPRSPEASRRLAEYYEAVGNAERGEALARTADFYAWLPPFVNLPFTTNHFATYEIISGAREVEAAEREKAVATLIASDDDDALIFLAALCYHHADHGELENMAFQALEAREEAGIPLLLMLFENAQSICTAGQAASALANQQCALAVDPLINSLSGDVRFIWTYNAAENLAKIGDPRAVSELIRMADVATELKKTEDDPMNEFTGRMAARYRAAFALGAFASERDVVEKTLTSGLDNPQMRVACQAGLYRLTGDELYAKALLDDLAKDDDDQYLLSIALDASNDPRARSLSGKLPKEKE